MWNGSWQALSGSLARQFTPVGATRGGESMFWRNISAHTAKTRVNRSSPAGLALERLWLLASAAWLVVQEARPLWLAGRPSKRASIANEADASPQLKTSVSPTALRRCSPRSIARRQRQSERRTNHRLSLERKRPEGQVSCP